MVATQSVSSPTIHHHTPTQTTFTSCRLVLDEVDMLLDESYYGDVRMIVQNMGGLRQVRFRFVE